MHKLKSRNASYMYDLSSLIQISEAFKRFGISDGDTSVMVVLVHSEDESKLLADITARVSGQQVPVEDVSSLSDQAKIKKVLLLFHFNGLILYNCIDLHEHMCVYFATQLIK